MAFLGIDLGTSGIRALLLNDAGAPIGSAEESYPTANPNPGWSEQNPSDWTRALDVAIQNLRSTHPEFSAIQGIAVSGHMHGAVLLNNAGVPIRPCIMWDDTRSHVQAAILDAMPHARERSGNITFPGFTAPKLEWLREHEPENHAKIAKVLLPASYLNFYLTGDFVADKSDCAGTGWFDVQKRDWSPQLLENGHMRRNQMPRLVEGCEIAGRLRDELRRDWGIAGSVIVAGGAGDNAAAACGIGALSEGQGLISLGTSGVLLLSRDQYLPAPETALHTFCHAVPDRWIQMGVILSASNSLNWLSKISGQTPAALTQALGDDIHPPSALRFLPYLSGERTPHNDAHIRGAFLGLDTGTSLADMTRAVLEGVAFALRDSAQIMKMTGAQIDRLFAVGGGAASRHWVQLIATVLDIPIALPKGGEFGAALGAARLAMIAASGQTAASIIHPPSEYDEIMPIAAMVPAFDQAYEHFKSAYPTLKAIS